MANLIASAFNGVDNATKTSGSVYQKQLQAPSIATPKASSDGLGAALVNLDNSLTGQKQSQNEVKKTVGITEAEKVVSQQSDQDMHKLSAIEMLGNYSKGTEIQDNPYAVVTIEKMRGQYIASQAHDEYTTWRSQQAPVKTASEEIQRYTDFMEKKRKEAENTSINLEAYNRGFTIDRQKNQIVIAGQQRTEQALELRAIQKGTTQAAIGSLVQQSDRLSDEDFTKGLNEVFANARITWMPVKDRVEFAKNSLQELAVTSGNYDRIEKVAKDVVIGTDDKGADVKLGDVVDTTEFKQTAYQRTSHIYGEAVQKGIKDLQGMTIPEQNNYYKNLQETDQGMYNVMLPFRKAGIDYREQLDHKKAVMEAKQRANDSLLAMADSALQTQIDAWMSDSLHDASGRVVASSKGALPALEVQDVDDKGNPIKKKMEWSDEILSAAVDRALQRIQGRGDISDEDKSAQVMKLLQFPPFEGYRGTVKNAFVSALDNASAANLKTSPEGWTNASPQLLSTLAMYRSNPSQFRTVFGEDATNRAAIIQTLSEGSNGDYAAGLAMYATAKENMKNKEFVHLQDKGIDESLTYSNMSGFTDLEGNPIDADMSLGTNGGAMRVISAQSKWMAYANKSPVDAVNAAKENAVKTYKVYDTTLVPEGLFGGINSGYRLAVGKQTLDDLKALFVQNSGCDPHYITTQYMPDSHSIVFQGGGQFKSYDANAIASWGNNLIKQAQEAPPQPQNNVSYQQVNDEREAAADVNYQDERLTPLP